MTAEQLEELLADYDKGMTGYAGSVIERHAVSLARKVIAAERLSSWLRYCLDCPAFKWDEDQREMAEIELTAYREASK